MRLTAYIDGVRVGWFDHDTHGAIALQYDIAWQQRRSRVELSLSLPKSKRRAILSPCSRTSASRARAQ